MSTETVASSKEEQSNNRTRFSQRVWGVIFSPANVMRDLVNRPRIVFAIFIIAFSVLIYSIIRFQPYFEFWMDVAEKGMDKESENYLVELQYRVVFFVFGSLISQPFVSLLGWLLGSLVLFAGVKAFKGEGTYKHVLSITGYSYIIILLFIIIQMFTSFFTGQLFLDTSLANAIKLLEPGMIGTTLYGILRGIDIFTIWRYIVIAIGLIYMSKLEKAKVISIVAVSYALTVFMNLWWYKMI